MISWRSVPVETVQPAELTSKAMRNMRWLSMRAWRSMHIADWRKWAKKDEDPFLKILDEAYRLGRRDEQDEVSADLRVRFGSGDRTGIGLSTPTPQPAVPAAQDGVDPAGAHIPYQS